MDEPRRGRGSAAVSVLCLVMLLAVAVAPATARAAFPGQDGSIVFASDYGSAPNHWNIWKINDPATYDPDFPTRASLTRLTDDEKNEQTSPSFSPDGRRITYVDEFRGGDKEIMVMNADGSAKTRLTSNGRQDGQPVFSPDGTRIAFASSRSGETEIWVMRSDGTGVRRLTLFSAIDKTTGRRANPHFTPDGSQIFFQGTTYNDVPWGDDVVYRADAYAEKPEHPTRLFNMHGFWDMHGFAFNATGTQWAYGVRESEKTKVSDLTPLKVFDPRWGPFKLYVSPAEGGCGYCGKVWKHLFPGKKLLGNKKFPKQDYLSPAFSPRGDNIVVQTTASPGSKPQLLMVSAVAGTPDNPQIRPLQIDRYSQIQPDWGPLPKP